MLSALRAAQHAGVDIRPLDVWSRDADFDILHVWGLEISQGLAVRWARKSGKRVVMTALLPYITIPHRLYYMLSSLCGTVKLRRELLRDVDALVVVNDLQAEAAQHLLRVPQHLLHVIPNIVEPVFFQNSSEAIPRDWHCKSDYILCAGNICARKNQVNLAQAALSLGCRLLVVGDVLAGEEAYGDALARTIQGQDTVSWVPGVPSSSPELVALYRNCVGFALPSFKEQQPISALEAAAVGKPLLLGDRPYARQRYYRNARLVDPASVASIKEGLRDILGRSQAHIPPAQFLSECTRNRVGEAYSNLYKALAKA